jgi:23S rRNA (uracil1939-C5)-methyltransferase
MGRRKKIYTGIRLSGPDISGFCIGYAGQRKLKVRYGIPGEWVNLQVTRREGEAYFAEISEIVGQSPDRIIPVCLHAGQCGGCDWQHISYETQLELKGSMIAELFKQKLHAVPSILPVQPSTTPFHYRNKLVFSFTNRRWFDQSEGMVTDPLSRTGLGFNMAGDVNRVITIKECHLSEESVIPISEFIFSHTKDALLTCYDFRNHEGLLKNLTIRIDECGRVALIFTLMASIPDKLKEIFNEIIKAFPHVTLIGWVVLDSVKDSLDHHALQIFYGQDSFLQESANGLVFKLHPFSFYQANRLQARVIFQKISELADLSGTENVVDLYCGIGTITLHLARQAGFVTGIDGSPTAISDAVANAKLNGITNVSFISGDVLKTFNDNYLQYYGEPDLVVLDPPRSGTLIEVKKTILKSRCKKIIYLSCNPVTLIRDLQMFLADYSISVIIPYDMFPQTHQIEVLVMLTRKSW